MLRFRVQIALQIALWAALSPAEPDQAFFEFPPDSRAHGVDQTQFETFTIGQNATFRYYVDTEDLELTLQSDALCSTGFDDSIVLAKSIPRFADVRVQSITWPVSLRSLPGIQANCVDRHGYAPFHLRIERKNDTVDVAQSVQFRIVNPATPLPSSELSTQSSGSTAPTTDKQASEGSIVGGAVAGTVVFVLILLGIGLFQRRKRRTKLRAVTGSIDKDEFRTKSELEANRPPVEIGGSSPAQELEDGPVSTAKRNQVYELP